MSAVANPRPYYTTKQIADRLSVHPDTIRRWEANGYIPKARRRPSGVRVWTAEDVDQIEGNLRPLHEWTEEDVSRTRATSVAESWRKEVDSA